MHGLRANVALGVVCSIMCHVAWLGIITLVALQDHSCTVVLCPLLRATAVQACCNEACTQAYLLSPILDYLSTASTTDSVSATHELWLCCAQNTRVSAAKARPSLVRATHELCLLQACACVSAR